MIHGGIKPRERKRVMREVKNLQFQFVVATDLAARGIDIEGVSHVINDDIPEDLDFFVHRVGRTGRQGMPGTAITLYSPDEEAKIAEIEAMGIKFQPKRISNGEIVDSYDRNRRQKRVKSTEKLDPTLIGLVKKKKKKSSQDISIRSSKQFTARKIRNGELPSDRVPEMNGNGVSVNPIVINNILQLTRTNRVSILSSGDK